MTDRSSPSGPVASVKGRIALAQVDIGATTGATATGSFTVTAGPNVAVNDVVSLSPRVNLPLAFSIGYCRVLSAGIVVVGFTNSGASSNAAAGTYDATAEKR